jgi:hypothetical protein
MRGEITLNGSSIGRIVDALGCKLGPPMNVIEMRKVGRPPKETIYLTVDDGLRPLRQAERPARKNAPARQRPEAADHVVPAREDKGTQPEAEEAPEAVAAGQSDGGADAGFGAVLRQEADDRR